MQHMIKKTHRNWIEAGEKVKKHNSCAKQKGSCKNDAQKHMGNCGKEKKSLTENPRQPGVFVGKTRPQKVEIKQKGINKDNKDPCFFPCAIIKAKFHHTVDG